jgi:hypothetical protein
MIDDYKCSAFFFIITHDKAVSHKHVYQANAKLLLIMSGYDSVPNKMACHNRRLPPTFSSI